MKKILILTLLFTLIETLYSDMNNDWIKNKLNGKIKKIIRFEYYCDTTCDTEKRKDELINKSIIQFNKNGMIIKEEFYRFSEKEKLEFKFINIYNKKNQITGREGKWKPHGESYGYMSSYLKSDSGTWEAFYQTFLDDLFRDSYLIYKEKYYYNKNNNLHNVLCYNNDNILVGKLIYKYSKNITSVSHYVGEKNILFKQEKFYNNNRKYLLRPYIDWFGYNAKIQHYKFNKKGILMNELGYEKTKCIFNIKYNYDKKGNYIGYIDKSNTNFGGIDKKYEYNKNGNLIKEFFYSRYHDEYYKTINHYNNKKNIIKKEFYLDDEFQNKYVYKYNKTHRLISKSEFNRKGELRNIIKYDYDKLNNCIEEKQYNNKKGLFGYNKNIYEFW